MPKPVRSRKAVRRWNDDPMSIANLGGSSELMSQLERREVDLPTPKKIALTLDGHEVTGFACKKLLGEGGCGKVFEAVCQTGGKGSPHQTVACKKVGPPSELDALYSGPFRAGCVLAVRCCEDDIDSSVQSLLETHNILQPEDDIALYWLAKVVKRAGRGADITVQWLEHDGHSTDSLKMSSSAGFVAEVSRDALVSVVRGNAQALQPGETGIQFGATAHADVLRDIDRAVRLEGAVEDATREFTLANKLRSSLCPCLMSARGGGVSDDAQTVMILMPKKESDLREVLRSQPCGMPEKEAQFYVASIVSALEELHRSANTVHLDVKSQNCLLSDGGRTLRLGDFGTATTAENCDDMNLQRYWPPELARAYLDDESRRSSGIAVDLWGLGCILYECLTGRHPIATQADDTDTSNSPTRATLDSDALKREEQTLREICAYAADSSGNSSVSQGVLRQRLWQVDRVDPISTEAMSFTEGLLEPDPKFRLGVGSMGGYAALKAHPFFQEHNDMPTFDWGKFSGATAMQTSPEAPATPESAAEPPAKKAKAQKYRATASAPSKSSNNH